jgi:hypothetical protein
MSSNKKLVCVEVHLHDEQGDELNDHLPAMSSLTEREEKKAIIAAFRKNANKLIESAERMEGIAFILEQYSKSGEVILSAQGDMIFLDVSPEVKEELLKNNLIGCSHK